jgi:hypothetical protein
MGRLADARSGAHQMANLEMRVTTRAIPVQIEGTIDGVPFYFYAKYDEWHFGAGRDPVQVTIDEGRDGGFYRSGQFDPDGDGHGASYMALVHAKAIVRECAASFLREYPSSARQTA